MSNNEIDAALSELMTKTGVEGYVVINYDGIPVKSHPENSIPAVQYAALVTDLITKTKSTLKMLDMSESDFTYLRMRTKFDKEIIVTNQIIGANEYILITIHSCKFGPVVKEEKEKKGEGEEEV
eukprot:CAMPEP_0168336752 /NCGR_PEP_ID=MMETSP0213-20121227/11750_1 /TAXON_ID=151035 /ORGANISM="Euplotes harpa, Strain FSP1.4" /LENGTH=123 /DNA_ID=CAMNT_0008342047 /DNA_START=11 /DNA_END=382 /DNA_ORIENTATION=-